MSLAFSSSGWTVTGTSTSKTAQWSRHHNDNWHINHTTSDATFDGFDLYYRQFAYGEFEFGTENFTTTASDNVWL